MRGFVFKINEDEIVLNVSSVRSLDNDTVYFDKTQITNIAASTMTNLKAAVEAYSGGGGGGSYDEGYSAGKTAIATSQESTAQEYFADLMDIDEAIAEADPSTNDGQLTIFSESYSYVKKPLKNLAVQTISTITTSGTYYVQANINPVSADYSLVWKIGSASSSSGYSLPEGSILIPGGENLEIDSNNVVEVSEDASIEDNGITIPSTGYSLFEGCDVIPDRENNRLKITISEDATYDGAFAIEVSDELSNLSANTQIAFNIEKTVVTPDYLCFTAEEEGSTVTLNKSKSTTFVSIDKINWSLYSSVIILSNVGDKVYFRGSAMTAGSSSTPIFTLTGKIAASGDYLTLIDPTGQTRDMGSNSFAYMFYNSSALTSTGDINISSVTANSSCAYMFAGCSSLTSISNIYLGNTTIYGGGYSYTLDHMFYNCTALKTIGYVQVNSPYNYCCRYMFSGCTSLETVERVYIGLVSTSVCQYMFSGCVSLNNVNSLYTGLYRSRYTTGFEYMFQNCTYLEKIKLENYIYPASASNWLSGAAEIGIIEAPYIYSVVSSSLIPSDWTLQTPVSYTNTNAFHITAKEDNVTVTINSSYNSDGTYLYSSDGSNWSQYTAGTTLSLDTDDTIYFVGNKYFNGEYNPSSGIEAGITINDGFVEISGDINSLVKSTNDDLNIYAIPSSAMIALFYQQTMLLEANFELPTIVSPQCYQYMFSGCTSLTTVPKLPAVTLSEYCYSDMFRGTYIDYIYLGATDVSATCALSTWYSSYGSTTGVIEKPTGTVLPSGTSGIPTGWSVSDI